MNDKLLPIPPGCMAMITKFDHIGRTVRVLKRCHEGVMDGIDSKIQVPHSYSQHWYFVSEGQPFTCPDGEPSMDILVGPKNLILIYGFDEEEMDVRACEAVTP